MNIVKRAAIISATALVPFLSTCVSAQEILPADNGISDYHTAPRWRETEAHPLRIFAYIAHPFGWAARELIFRPLSYFASSDETNRSVMGYREPNDYRSPECFSPDATVPDCKTIKPFDYALGEEGSLDTQSETSEVYFPNVYFDFARRDLNAEGKAQAKILAENLSSHRSVRVVLEGHTDYIGSSKSNEELGLDRAEALKSELESLGISSERLSTLSFGESQPIDTGRTAEARAKNRRVEVKLDGK